MNFFESQERARRSSTWLVLWFLLSVAGVVIVLYVALALAWQMKPSRSQRDSYSQSHSSRYEPIQEAKPASDFWWNPKFFLFFSSGVGGVMVLGSMSKHAQLSAGGKVVAKNLGARAVDPGTKDLRERQLLNVVEEMSIASGVPMPGVWVMDEERGINAFAAGTDPTNAVIAVTRGTLERLTRSELQGVVAHEFSHILNGDMKLNMRLIGWIFGLVMLASLGQMLMRLLSEVRVSNSDSKGNKNPLFLLFLSGAIIWAIGSVGVFFARLIQAGISRQREFLADASAVQFTRDPSGIAGALKKIGGFPSCGTISSANAEDARHLFFVSSTVKQWLATHPKLQDRIRALEPNWTGGMLSASIVPINPEEGQEKRHFSSKLAMGFQAPLIQNLGESSQLNQQVGQAILQNLASDHLEIHSKQDAKCLLLGLLLTEQNAQLPLTQQILKNVDDTLLIEQEVVSWSRKLAPQNSAQKLALVDLAIAWLRSMRQDEAQRLITASQALIHADGKLDLFEFFIQKVIERHVEIGLGLRAAPEVRFFKMKPLAKALAELLSAVASMAGGDDALQPVRESYRSQTGMALVLIPLDQVDLASALRRMDAASPFLKKQILKLCAKVVLHDQQVQETELILLRTIAEAIGSPLPPLTTAIAA